MRCCRLSSQSAIALQLWRKGPQSTGATETMDETMGTARDESACFDIFGRTPGTCCKCREATSKWITMKLSALRTLMDVTSAQPLPTATSIFIAFWIPLASAHTPAGAARTQGDRVAGTRAATSHCCPSNFSHTSRKLMSRWHARSCR